MSELGNQRRGGALLRRLALGAAVTLSLSCDRGRPAPAAQADVGAPAAPAGSAVPAAARVVSDGLAIAFELRPLSGPVVANTEASAVFTITDAATGAPVRGLRPLAWMSRRGAAGPPGAAACKKKVKSYMAGLISEKADVDMSAYHVWVLGRDGTIAIIDPTVAFSATKLQGVIPLSSRPADWAMSPDRGSVYVSLPEAKSVAVVDVRRRAAVARVPVGENPARVAPAPDGRRVWVGNDGSRLVSVIDTRTSAVEKAISVGPGHHEIAFADQGRTAWITGSEGDHVTAVDTQSLEVLGSVSVGRGAAAIAVSDVAPAIYVAGGETGEVVVIDAARREIVNRIGLKRGLAALRFDPSGRFAFVANRAAGELAILDAASGRIARTLTGLGAPDALTFTGSFAYVRQPGAAKMSLIELNTIDREGSLAAVEVPIGQTRTTEARSGLAPLIAATPEGNGVMVANPADDNLYYYVEGMMAPIGSNRSYTRPPEGLLVVDRALSEGEPGMYSATVRLAGAGPYDVSILLDKPRSAACLDVVVSAAPGSAPEVVGPGITVAPLFDLKVHLRSGEPATLRFRMPDSASPAPIAAEEIEVLIIRFPGSYRFRGRPKDEGNGEYSVTFTPPLPGQYRLLASVESRGLALGKIPYLTLGVEGDVAPSAKSEGGERP